MGTIPLIDNRLQTKEGGKVGDEASEDLDKHTSGLHGRELGHGKTEMASSMLLECLLVSNLSLLLLGMSSSTYLPTHGT